MKRSWQEIATYIYEPGQPGTVDHHPGLSRLLAAGYAITAITDVTPRKMVYTLSRTTELAWPECVLPGDRFTFPDRRRAVWTVTEVDDCVHARAEWLDGEETYIRTVDEFVSQAPEYIGA